MVVSYEPAGPAPRVDGPQRGTADLARQLKAAYPRCLVNEGPYGIFNPRRIAGSKAWSLHAEGRAIDVGVPVEQRGDKGDGWRLACELVASAGRTGVQRVIWDGHIWSIEWRDRNWRLFTGSDKHRDHVHVEQRWAWADGRRGVRFR